MNYILFDDEARKNLLPLTFTRPVADIRIGILTIREKWEKYLQAKTFSHTEKYLQEKFPKAPHSHEDIIINGSICPDKELVNEINKYGKISSKTNLLRINNLWDIFTKNGEAIERDFELLTTGRKSQAISKTNKVVGGDVFAEEGAKIECSILNASTGPIYIGKNAEVMEGCIVRGPFAMCENSVLKMGAKIYGPTTIGPWSKVGGEVNNCVILGYSNKAHEGFLGNSVIGEWCNIGADTNNSNLKNNYSEVKLWNYGTGSFEKTGLQFCGLIMGDHSKCGINTMFNTGTVVGVNANIFGAGFPENFVPSFSWGGAAGFTTYKIEQAFAVAARVFERRGLVFNEMEQEILSYIFELTESSKKT